MLGVSLLAQSQPNCTGIALEVDARCSCIKDPNSDVCKLNKMGLYDGTMKMQPIPGVSGPAAQPSGAQPATAQPAARTVEPKSQPARPQQARVVPLAHTDYLRFLPPNARLVAGFDLAKALQSPELLQGVFGNVDGEEARKKVAAALKEMDHLWISFVPPNDLVIVTTGKFEQGAAAGMFYAQGILPVFLGGAHAMMVGQEPSIQAALARLGVNPAQPHTNAAKTGPGAAKPGANAAAKTAPDGNAATDDSWIVRRARELSRDHETWVVTDVLGNTAGPLKGIRKFALGFRLAGEGSVDGEVIADSDAGASEIIAWIDRMKGAVRDKNVGALDSLNVKADGSAVRFSVAGDALLAGEAGKSAMSSDFGVEVYALTMAGFPGMPARTAAADKLASVRVGMKREEVLDLLGQPLSVAAIQGIDPPRETWTYQIPFGKRVTMKLDGGVVATAPR